MYLCDLDVNLQGREVPVTCRHTTGTRSEKTLLVFYVQVPRYKNYSFDSSHFVTLLVSCSFKALNDLHSDSGYLCMNFKVLLRFLGLQGRKQFEKRPIVSFFFYVNQSFVCVFRGSTTET